MRRVLLLISLLFFVVSCGPSVSEDDLAQLTGYWEIQEAKMPDGSVKEYKINPTIDYFQIKGKNGFRKKVMPQFNGKYLVNDLSEKIQVTETEGKFYLNYITKYSKWKEEIVELSDDELVLKNEHNMEYHYKKPEPFTVK